MGVTANEVLDLLEEVSGTEDRYMEEIDFETVTDEELDEYEYFEEDEDEVDEGKKVVRGGKVVTLDTMQTKRLAIKNKLKAAGKIGGGRKLVFKKGSTSYTIKAMTSADKARARVFGKKAQTGTAKAKRARSAKKSRSMR